MTIYLLQVTSLSNDNGVYLRHGLKVQLPPNFPTNFSEKFLQDNF